MSTTEAGGGGLSLSYLNEHEDAEDTRKWIQDAGRKAVLVPGGLTDPARCRTVIDRAVDELGRVDVLVSNAAFQMTHQSLEEISDEEWDHTLAVNLSAMFPLCKAALPHMPAGGSIIGTTSVNSDISPPQLLAAIVAGVGASAWLCQPDVDPPEYFDLAPPGSMRGGVVAL
jgi:NAD(P)-dependent dehydrogenase (short-subunit alcohol dehydrogenase family)